MRLPLPTNDYSMRIEVERNRTLEFADAGNHKRSQDIEVGSARLILTSPNGTRYSVAVDNSGNLSASSL